ncbi:MAG: ATP-binding protein [Candidatus Woesearchaeota archaeon]
MEREKLYSVLFNQQKEFLDKNDIIARELEVKAVRLLKTKMPLIITGVRRCGKSTLLKLIKNNLGLKDTEILYVNFNDERLANFSTEDFQKILDYMQENKYPKNSLILLDEIQETTEWEKWVDRIKDMHQLIITGSNSKLLSSELATVLTGRTLSIRLYPFSFKEYLKAKNVNITSWGLDSEVQNNIRNELKNYLELGGFPKRVLTNERTVLVDLYENIVYRDILSRFGNKQTKNIKEILQYILSNNSKQISTRTLSEISKIKNLATIKKILDTLEGAFLIFTLTKYDYSMQKQIQNPKKVYCIDNGIITTNGFRFSENKGQLLENMIFVELKRRDKEIYYYSDKNECDFVSKEGIKITHAIQVCYDLNDNNKDREIKGLIEAMIKFDLKEGVIITFDQEDSFVKDKKNIKVIPVWKWLLENSNHHH